MYKLRKKPYKKVKLEGGSIHTPIATLKDEYGGVSHIIVDDHCYVLVNGKNTVKHWFRQAVEAVQQLPLPN